MFRGPACALLWILVILFGTVKPEPLNDQVSLSKRATIDLAITANFPDPSIIKVNGTWYAFATHTRGTNIKIQVAKSSNFEDWSIIKNADGSQFDALPVLPVWVRMANYLTWAPDVQQLDDGSFIMYYSATTAARPDGSKHCVGAATSPSILGPYTGLPDALFCPLSKGGAIDAAGFKDRDGRRYVVYKVDGNSQGRGGACGNTVAPIVGTPLMLQPVAADGYTFTGNAVALLDNDGAADQGILEAPVLTRSRAGVYFLFFSSGCFATSGYTVSYATATSLMGPYTRASGPLFRTGDGNGLKAPGGMSVWGDNRHMVLHANYGGGRAMYTTLIALKGTEVITV
ncbi:Arabinanase/levansucrase/invertase [Aureobasidium subglaciale]|nr:Arabinanase/levansucrase/invertase [Aureobasidium subglaciale]